MKLMHETDSYLTNSGENRNYSSDSNRVKLLNSVLITINKPFTITALSELALFSVAEVDQTCDTHRLNLKMNEEQKYITYNVIHNVYIEIHYVHKYMYIKKYLMYI